MSLVEHFIGYGFLTGSILRQLKYLNVDVTCGGRVEHETKFNTLFSMCHYNVAGT